MNILFFTTLEPTLFTGGIERFALTFGNRFAKDGHQVVYIAQKHYNPDAPKTDCRHNVYVIPNSEYVEAEENVVFVQRIVEKYAIDIIFNQQADGVHLVNLCHIVKQRVNGLKVVSILHFSPNHSLRMFEMSFRHIIKSKLSLRQQFNLIIRNTSLYRAKIRKYLRKLFSTMYVKSDAVILLSEKSIPIFAELAGLQETTKLYAIPNPVTNLIGLNTSNKKNRILYVGRCEVLEKRINLLLDIWKLAAPKLPDWKLDGLGNGNYYEIVKERILKEGINRINLCGYCSPDQYYAQSKILLLTSSTEGFPLVLLEAANLRTPSILFNSFEAASDIVIDGKTGYIVSPYDIKQFANRIVELASNEQKLQQFSQNAYEHAQEFTIDKIVTEWYKIFEKITTKK